MMMMKRMLLLLMMMMSQICDFKKGSWVRAVQQMNSEGKNEGIRVPPP